MTTKLSNEFNSIITEKFMKSGGRKVCAENSLILLWKMELIILFT
jgi:hypothetical protein